MTFGCGDGSLGGAGDPAAEVRVAAGGQRLGAACGSELLFDAQPT